MIIQDRTFVISGGASGLGRATAQLLHSAGGYIALLDMNEDNGAEVANSLDSSGKRTKFIQCDVSETTSVTSAVEQVTSWAGKTGAQIGGVICAAGVGHPGKVIDRKGNPVSLEQFDFVVNINLRGTIDLVRQLLPSMTKNKPLVEGSDDPADLERGVLILVSSVAAYDGQTGQLAYSASKGALTSLTLPLARDLAEFGVRVVAVAPGVFSSSMTDMMSGKVKKSLEGAMEFPKRMGKADEFARLVKEVLENRMLNATTIRLDGGVRMPSKM